MMMNDYVPSGIQMLKKSRSLGNEFIEPTWVASFFNALVEFSFLSFSTTSY
jgi:hypothetical protein